MVSRVKGVGCGVDVSAGSGAAPSDIAPGVCFALGFRVLGSGCVKPSRTRQADLITHTQHGLVFARVEAEWLVTS